MVLIVIIAVAAFYLGSNFKKAPDVAILQTASTTQATTTVGTDNDGMEDEHAFLQADYNFDGNADRLKMLDCGATGNCSYEVELYDPKAKTYSSSVDSTPTDLVQEPGADGEISFVVTNPVVNKVEQLVCSYANIGANSYHVAVYKYSAKDNTFREVKAFSGTSDKVHACSLK